MTYVDFAILGSGYAGSILAQVLRRLGYSVALIERGSHPRFAIGESTSPLANLLLEQIAHRYDLPSLLPLATFGAWQRVYPHIGVGLKRGFTYYHHPRPDDPGGASAVNSRLMVAASPNKETADTHWFRAGVDELLMQQAVGLGAMYCERTTVSSVVFSSEGVDLQVVGQEGSHQLQANFVVDATGPRGALSRLLGIEPASYPNYPVTSSLYGHFEGVTLFDTDFAFHEPQAPYPPDAAAVHHLFEGGWIWCLRFQNGITSAGVVLEESAGFQIAPGDEAASWKMLMDRFPSIRRAFSRAIPVQPFVLNQRVAYRTSHVVGNRWALMPSCAGFIDPLFSTGIPMALLGIERFAGAVNDHYGRPGWREALSAYETTTLHELDWVAEYIGGCYRSFGRPERFNTLSMCYFAIASFSEMARRLDNRALQYGFLGADSTQFKSGVRKVIQVINDESVTTDEFESMVRDVIENINVAGLLNPSKRNLYNVDLNDLVVNAHKLGLTPAEMQNVLSSADWAQVEDTRSPV